MRLSLVVTVAAVVVAAVIAFDRKVAVTFDTLFVVTLLVNQFFTFSLD